MISYLFVNEYNAYIVRHRCLVGLCSWRTKCMYCLFTYFVISYIVCVFIIYVVVLLFIPHILVSLSLSISRGMMRCISRYLLTIVAIFAFTSLCTNCDYYLFPYLAISRTACACIINAVVSLYVSP